MGGTRRHIRPRTLGDISIYHFSVNLSLITHAWPPTHPNHQTKASNHHDKFFASSYAVFRTPNFLAPRPSKIPFSITTAKSLPIHSVPFISHILIHLRQPQHSSAYMCRATTYHNNGFLSYIHLPLTQGRTNCFITVVEYRASHNSLHDSHVQDPHRDRYACTTPKYRSLPSTLMFDRLRTTFCASSLTRR